MMTVDELKASVRAPAPPDGLPTLLQAMWFAEKGDWHQAHKLVQGDDSAEAAWVHAYLHRVEGDLSNAGYWYRRAGQSKSTAPLDAEWADIVGVLLTGGDGPN